MNTQELKLWNESEEQIDSRVDKILSEKRWDTLFPDGLVKQDRMEAFYKHIMFVINSFLEEDETRELFIQLPVEELANRDPNGGDAKQVKRFRWLNGTIAVCLQMATIEQLRKNVFVPDGVDFDNTLNWYKEGDCFFIGEIERKNKKEKGFCDYKKKKDSYGVKDLTEEDLKKLFPEDNEEDREIKLEKLCLRFYSSNGPDFTNPKQTFSRCQKSTIAHIKHIPSQKKDGAKRIQNEIAKIERVSALKKQYKSAAVVSIGKYKPLNVALVDNHYLDIPNNYISDYHDLKNEDVIVICGDSKYKDCAQAYRNSDAKKIIYIGSEAPFEKIKTYPFTFREMYRYSSLKMSFTEPTMKIISFPWLENKQKELEDVLDDCMKKDDEFTEEDRNRVLRNLICSLSRYDFDANQLQRIKEKFSEDNIDTKFELSIDVSDYTITKISSWIQSLEFASINPKAKWINSQKATLILGKNSSYRNRNSVKGLCGYNNKIIADNLTDSNKDKRFPYILKHHLFADITAIYYKNELYALKKLQEYIDKEAEYYSADLRKSLGTDININKSKPMEELPDWLEKFFDEEYNINISISTQSDKCYVTFEDGTNDIVDGEVIADLGEEGYDTINIREAEKGMIISYYHTPKNLDELIAACEEYKESWNMVIKYSNLWKDKFRELYNSKISQGISREEAIKEICSSSGLKKEMVKSYTKEYDSRFLRSKKEMRNVLNYLESLHLITEDDKKKVMLAKYYSSFSLKFGTRLKKELYDSFMIDFFKSPLLNEISKNSGLSKDAIFESAIVSNKKIRTIKIVTNNE